jgi:hypothetical protein
MQIQGDLPIELASLIFEWWLDGVGGVAVSHPIDQLLEVPRRNKMGLVLESTRNLEFGRRFCYSLEEDDMFERCMSKMQKG